MEQLFRWLRSAWYGERKKGPGAEEVVVHFKLPDGKEIDITAIKPENHEEFLEYQKQLHCRLHENYSGATEPINNCNVCWEIYSEKRKAFR